MSRSQRSLGKLRERQARGGSSELPCSPVAAVGPHRCRLGSARPQVSQAWEERPDVDTSRGTSSGFPATVTVLASRPQVPNP
ncbi:unnamed protein product [Coccothraustes coccothraustes]